jgi:class 3 adenylate cyclase
MDTDARESTQSSAHSRRKRRLVLHALVTLFVDAAFVATWVLSRVAAPPRAESLNSGFWPGWIMLLTALPLALHGLYVVARRPIAEGAAGHRRATGRRVATVLFTDIVNSTERARQLGDMEWRKILDRHDRMASDVVRRHGGALIKYTGDGMLATFDAPGTAIRSAVGFRGRMRGLGLEIRAGLHSGEVEFRGRGDEVGGIAVHVASRVMAAAGPGQVLVSGTVRDLVEGSSIELDDGSIHQLKGMAGGRPLYAVVDIEKDRPGHAAGPAL